MAEYIKKEDIEQKIQDGLNNLVLGHDAIEVLGMIYEMPTADVAPVVHGRWRYFHKQNIAVCTECSFERDLDTNFGRAVNCPNCGAKMDGGKNDEHQN